MEARNRAGLGLSCRPARLHRLAEWIPWIRLLGSLKVKKIPAQIRSPIPTKPASNRGGGGGGVPKHAKYIPEPD
jgi:hypothetical protein